LKKQATGNAIEKMGKNIILFSNFVITEDISPNIYFLSGTDFHNDLSIQYRVNFGR
jgi:hypothetical protein